MIKARRNWIWCSGITTVFLVGVGCCGHADGWISWKLPLGD